MPYLFIKNSKEDREFEALTIFIPSLLAIDIKNAFDEVEKIGIADPSRDLHWELGKRLFFQDCPWHQKYYSSKFPFVHKYDGNIKHCLIDYS